MAWGDNDYGQCNVPAPNSGFVVVAAGWFHSLGLKADGSIVAWGANWYGQCNVPAPNSGFVAVAAGGHHNLAIRGDGDGDGDGVPDSL
ncbi:MAG TPA: RCC1 domain-containing protein, partial [Phycisphaerae bacterium]|nr:RCC1 domain-containing protein [Phycisphaerae bacterium]